MSYILPSREFEGSAVQTYVSSPYVNHQVPRMLFNSKNNPEGAYILFLPAYKLDSMGRGVWFKKITVRDNFGASFKEKYYVADKGSDPAEYFAFNYIRIHGFDSVRPQKDKSDKGRTFMKYPNFGRLTERVLFNVTYYRREPAELQREKVYVLDLPLINGANKLLDYTTSKQIDGSYREPINHPARCVPVKVGMTGEGANPWVIQVESSDHAVALPPNLANLNHLDEILIQKDPQEIISKLREMYPADFDTCMEGYPGLYKSAVSMSAPIQAPVGLPTQLKPLSQPTPIQQPAQAAQINPLTPPFDPNKNHVTALDSIKPPTLPVNPPPAAVDISSLPANPMSGGSFQMSREEVYRFITEDNG